MGIEEKLHEAWNQGQVEELHGILNKATPQERLQFEKWVSTEGRFQEAPFQLQLKTVRVLTDSISRSQKPLQEEDKEVAKLADSLQKTGISRHQGITGLFYSVWDWVDWTKESASAFRANLPETCRTLFKAETRGIERAAELIRQRASSQLVSHLWNLSPDQAEELVSKQPDLVMSLVESGMFEGLCVLSAKLKPETLMRVWENPSHVHRLISNFKEHALVYLADKNLGLDFAKLMLSEKRSGKNGLYAAIEYAGVTGLAFVADNLSAEDFKKAAFARYRYNENEWYETFLLATSTHNAGERTAAISIFAEKLPEDAVEPFSQRVLADYQRPIFQLTEALARGAEVGVLVATITPFLVIESVKEIGKLIHEAKRG